jgi:hypothetical protein
MPSTAERTLTKRLIAPPPFPTPPTEAFVLTVANDATMALLPRMEANLRFANLGGGNLQGALVIGADLRFANLKGADLRYADLQGARGLTEEQIEWTIGPLETKLPEGLNRPQLWSKDLEAQRKIVKERLRGLVF